MTQNTGRAQCARTPDPCKGAPECNSTHRAPRGKARTCTTLVVASFRPLPRYYRADRRPRRTGQVAPGRREDPVGADCLDAMRGDCASSSTCRSRERRAGRTRTWPASQARRPGCSTGRRASATSPCWRRIPMPPGSPAPSTPACGRRPIAPTAACLRSSARSSATWRRSSPQKRGARPPGATRSPRQGWRRCD
jgi:hypothetical protein